MKTNKIFPYQAQKPRKAHLYSYKHLIELTLVSASASGKKETTNLY